MASPNMGMTIPTVAVTPGPTWAQNVNSDLLIIDSHDHTPGKGVQITPDALNMSGDLSFNTTSSITNIKKVGYTSQSAALSGTNFLSFIGGDLYVNDGSGNQIPITSSGGVAGSPGSIGSLVSPAAATYSAGSKTFSWTADSLKAAAMDNGAITIRETDVASANGVTLQSPSSLAADYSITLLAALPGSTEVLTMNSSGNLGNVTYDTVGTSMTATGADAIGGTMTATGANPIANVRTRAVTTNGTDPGAGGVSISLSSGSFATSSTSITAVTNQSCVLTTSGRPVYVGCISSGGGSSNEAQFTVQNPGTAAQAFVVIKRDTTEISRLFIENVVQGSASTNSVIAIPASAISHIDTPAAGSYTYTISVFVVTGCQISVLNVKTIVYEL